jgi:hypothetical protein
MRERRPSRSISRMTLSPTGEELLVVAQHAGLDAMGCDELRRAMFHWSQRFFVRMGASDAAAEAEAAGLVALTIDYLRRYLKSA